MISILRKLNCVFLVFAILLGTTVEIKYVDSINIPGRVVLILIYLFCITGILIEWHWTISKKAILYFIGIGFFLAVYIVASRVNSTWFIRSYCIPILLFFLYSYLLQKNNAFHVLMYTFRDILLIIGLITLFFWLFGSILQIAPGRKQITYTWTLWGKQSAYTYFYVYFENPVQNQQLLGMTIARNCGIYTEVPAYATVLLIAICVEWFGPRKISKLRLIAFLAVILSTQSTKALIILLVLFGIRFIFEGNKGKPPVRVFFKVLFSIILIAAISFAISYILEDKSTANNSFAARMNHMLAGFATFRKNPIFGAGFQNTSAIIENEASGTGNGGISMGLTVLLAYGGIYLTAFYFVAFFVALKKPEIQLHKKNYLYFCLMLLMNLFVSNNAFGYPYIFLIASAYASGAMTVSKMKTKTRSGNSIKLETNA